MEDNTQSWTSPEDDLLLGRNASEYNKKIVRVTWKLCIVCIFKCMVYKI
jgi:hypothetical protein